MNEKKKIISTIVICGTVVSCIIGLTIKKKKKDKYCSSGIGE